MRAGNLACSCRVCRRGGVQEAPEGWWHQAAKRRDTRSPTHMKDRPQDAKQELNRRFGKEQATKKTFDHRVRDLVVDGDVEPGAVRGGFVVLALACSFVLGVSTAHLGDA